MKSSDKKRMSIISHTVLITLTCLALIPFILLIIASFTDDVTAIRNGYSFFPEKWSLDAYRYIINEWKTIGRAYFITVFITIVGTICNLSLISTLAYALSKKSLPGRNILNFGVIFTMLFSGGLVPTYMVYTQIFNIKNTIWALIVPNLLMNAFTVMLVKNYFQYSIPESLSEAAKIDGASEFKIFVKIILPLAKPILATVGLMAAITYWNDWQNGLYYLDDRSLYSIQNILNQINQNIQFLATSSLSTNVNTATLPTTTIRMAIAVVGILPILVAYPFFQKYFVKGITLGSVKE